VFAVHRCLLSRIFGAAGGAPGTGGGGEGGDRAVPRLLSQGVQTSEEGWGLTLPALVFLFLPPGSCQRGGEELSRGPARPKLSGDSFPLGGGRYGKEVRRRRGGPEPPPLLPVPTYPGYNGKDSRGRRGAPGLPSPSHTRLPAPPVRQKAAPRPPHRAQRMEALLPLQTCASARLLFKVGPPTQGGVRPAPPPPGTPRPLWAQLKAGKKYLCPLCPLCPPGQGSLSDVGCQRDVCARREYLFAF